MSNLTLFIGDKNLSSWSLRPWLMLKQTGIPFTEKLIPLDKPETKGAILERSPSGLVPCLVDGPAVVWDSLAIAEYLAETFPDAGLWPDDRLARAHARSSASAGTMPRISKIEIIGRKRTNRNRSARKSPIEPAKSVMSHTVGVYVPHAAGR